MKSAIERRMAAGFGVVVFMLIFIACATLQTSVRYAELNGWMDRSRSVQTRIEEVHSRIGEAQASVYRYFLTGDRRHLEARKRAVLETQNALNHLGFMTSDHPAQQLHLKQLREQIQKRIAISDGGIALKQEHRESALTQWLDSSYARYTGAELQKTLSAMQEEETRLLSDRKLRYDQFDRQVHSAFFLIVGVVFASLAFVYGGVRALDRRARNAHLRVINTLESITDGFFSLDQDWNFTYLNSEAECLLQRNRGDLLGVNVWKAFPGAVETAFDVQYHRAVQEQVSVHFEEFFAPQNRWYEVRAYPSPDGISVYFQDITQRKQAAEALLESEARNRALLSVLPDLMFVQDENGIYVDYHAADPTELVIEPERFLGKHMKEFMPPDLFNTLNGALTLLKETGEMQVREYSLLLNEEMHHFEARMGRDERGRFLTIVRNVTEKHWQENALRISETRFRAALDGSLDAFFLLESVRGKAGEIEDFQFVEINTQAEWMLTLSRDQVIGKKLCELLPIQRRDGFFEKYVQVVQTRRVLDEQFTVTDPQINAYWVHHQVVPVGDGIAITSHDISDAKEMEEQIQAQIAQVNEARVQLELRAEELRHSNLQLESANSQLESLATTDGLTGLKNHRTFQENLASAFERALRYQTPLSVILLDVDHFKSYNDTFGHPAGDGVLKTVAQLLLKASRTADLVARYGGEEFIVILPETETAGALEAAERFRADIESARWTERPVTASFGVATLNLAILDAAALVAEADRALYCAKNGGRNRVRHASEGSSPESAPPLASSLETPA